MSLTLTLIINDGDPQNVDRQSEQNESAQSPRGITPTRIISGQEAISSLYAYDILVKTTEDPDTILQQLGKRVSLLVQDGGKSCTASSAS